ncbi:hypothetical protein SAMN05660284_01518 [Formivibrio citricus]|uniref:Regulatory protein, FmdB family n=1 Tax=Formivibrio citricus TaxID=83765 RepID=A0A1I4Z4S0_9NEIS|nr:hypothetical protein [Formivibrio citricus]SFN44969.1 hypothetical protein SAMN05660284_01518 [Formivibrio citricus]
MIRPQPMLYRCPKCGWKDVFAPKSDMLIEKPWEACPNCGGHELECKPAGAMDVAVEKLSKIFS